ncbi:MFS transporter [Hahella ganghwensis]|uniref:MFS transporter n=1 Tax=Hahella ganghwensis TaxID=286420 RepID=UPI0003723178|nr:MFS transporter [Hahella ganghwensis]
MSTVLTEQLPKSNSLKLLLLILIANGAAHSLFVIAFPVLGRSLGLTDIQTGLILTVSSIAMMASAPFWGARSEIAGRRSIIAIGIVVTGLFLILAAGAVYLRQNLLITASMSFFILFGLRLSQAIGVGGVMPAAQAYVADSTGPEHRARGMGKMGAAFGIGTIAGGAIAMALGQVSIVLGLSGLGVVLVFIWWLGCSRLPESREPGEITSNLSFKLPYEQLWPMLLITFCGLLIYGTLQQVIGLRLQDEFGFSAGEALKGTGAVMMASMAAMVVTQGGLMRWLTWSPERLLVSGCLVMVIALTAATSATTYPVLLVGMILLGLGMGLVFPGNLALLSLAVDEDTQGRIAGINSVSKGIGMALGPVTGAFLHQFSVITPFVFAVLLGALMLILSAWVIKGSKLADTEERQSA